MSESKKPETILIVGRRWSSRKYGNTYHTAEVFIDGKRVGKTESTYGYGDMYLWSAFEWMEKNELIPPREDHGNGSREVPWVWAARHGVKLSYTYSDVSREKDL